MGRGAHSCLLDVAGARPGLKLPPRPTWAAQAKLCPPPERRGGRRWRGEQAQRPSEASFLRWRNTRAAENEDHLPQQEKETSAGGQKLAVETDRPPQRSRTARSSTVLLLGRALASASWALALCAQEAAAGPEYDGVCFLGVFPSDSYSDVSNS